MSYRKKVSDDYVKNQYVNIYKSQTGCIELTKDEDEFFTKFTKFEGNSQARIIFFNAVFMLKKNYSRFVIYFFIHREIKIAFKKEKAPLEIQQLSSFFARDILHNSIIYYCKIEVVTRYEYDIKSSQSCYQKIKLFFKKHWLTS